MSVDKKKYPGYNENDTFWDEHHRSRGEMTNREFFTSNGPGGFYEGMEWDAEKEEWVPNAAARQRQYEYEQANKCSECGGQKPYCECY
jgi:hypothetical protein